MRWKPSSARLSAIGMGPRLRCAWRRRAANAPNLVYLHALCVKRGGTCGQCAVDHDHTWHAPAVRDSYSPGSKVRA